MNDTPNCLDCGADTTAEPFILGPHSCEFEYCELTGDLEVLCPECGAEEVARQKGLRPLC